MNTTENNKLIAEFMGKGFFENNPLHEVFNYSRMKFHKDWNWLMEVVEKIEEITISDENLTIQEHRFLVEMSPTQCEIYDNVSEKLVGSGDCGNKLKSTYQAVVKFIKWYNQKQSNEESI